MMKNLHSKRWIYFVEEIRKSYYKRLCATEDNWCAVKEVAFTFAIRQNCCSDFSNDKAKSVLGFKHKIAIKGILHQWPKRRGIGKAFSAYSVKRHDFEGVHQSQLFFMQVLNPIGIQLNSSEMQSSDERVKNFRVVSFTEDTVDSEGQPIIGIKDLLDLNGDYHLIEFIKFEMHGFNERNSQNN